MIKVRNLDTNTAKPEPIKASLFSPIEPRPEIKPEPQPAPTANDTDELHRQAQLAAKFGALVTITGAWVWAGFDHMPNKETREALKANKWIWCANKGKWAYRGKPSTSRKPMSWDYITGKYGEEKIEEKI
jgi:hypothetical protein